MADHSLITRTLYSMKSICTVVASWHLLLQTQVFLFTFSDPTRPPPRHAQVMRASKRICRWCARDKHAPWAWAGVWHLDTLLKVPWDFSTLHSSLIVSMAVGLILLALHKQDPASLLIPTFWVPANLGVWQRICFFYLWFPVLVLHRSVHALILMYCQCMY